MHSFHRFARLLGSSKEVVNVNSANDQDPLVGLDFALDVGTQPAVARIYFARLQRAPEGSEHSTTERGDNIVKSCGMRFGEFCRIQAIMPGNRSMNAEDYWLRLSWQLCDSKRARPPFDPNVGHIHWI
jgi:hypothetical protein